jgi:hypothetical protein
VLGHELAARLVIDDGADDVGGQQVGTSDSVLTVSVLARPGTPSSRMCPPVSIPIKMRSSIAFWPMMTLPTSALILSMKADCLWTSSFMTRTSMAPFGLRFWVAGYG